MDEGQAETGTEVVAAIITSFPALIPYLKEWVERQGYDDGELRPYSVLERFADATSEAISCKDESRAIACLALVESFLTAGDADLRAFLDVAYCENLMWDIRDEELKRWGYALFPPQILQLYTEMWGAP